MILYSNKVSRMDSRCPYEDSNRIPPPLQKSEAAKCNKIHNQSLEFSILYFQPRFATLKSI
jgi:hypothetical protein